MLTLTRHPARDALQHLSERAEREAQTMEITLSNNFHEREITVRVPDLPATLTPSQVRRVRDELCGHADCTCGGIRGPQHTEGIGRLVVYADGDSEGHATWTVERDA